MSSEKMPLILRAIITGFGYKLGAEIARYAATRIGLIKSDKAGKEEPAEDIPEGITNVPEDGDDDPEADDDDDDVVDNAS